MAEPYFLVSTPEFPKEQIQQCWDAGCNVRKIWNEGGLYHVYGTTESARGQQWQTRHSSKEFFEGAKELIDQNYRLLSLAVKDGEWFSVYEEQDPDAWVQFKAFVWDEMDLDNVKPLWNEGYYITDAAYDREQYALLLAANPKIERQAGLFWKTWPQEAVENYQAEGYAISKIMFTAQSVFITMDKYADLESVVYVREDAEEFPTAKTEEALDQGYGLISICRLQGVWFNTLIRRNEIGPTGT